MASLLVASCTKEISIPRSDNFPETDVQKFSFTGAYDSTWGMLNFHQDGSRITGSGGGFSFKGDIKGSRAEGAYNNFIIQGQFYFLMSEDGRYLKGRYSNNLADSGDWFAERTGLPVALEPRPGSPRPGSQTQEPEVARAQRSTPVSKPALKLSFRAGVEQADDVAVVIGNANYRRAGKDIPDVDPAHADAGAVTQYVRTALGVREGNIIDLRDATGAQFVRVFGSKDNPLGQLHDWVKPGKSRVFVYYAGHGAPGANGAYLIPSDADAARIELTGYPLSTLYDNLGKLPANSVTVVLEACFSGVSQAGSVVANASPVYARAAAPQAPQNVTVIAAGSANQIASWEEDKSHGLFTKYYLTAMAGAADKAPYGNGDGRVDHAELKRYLDDTLTYYARRYYGRDQNAQIVAGGKPAGS